MKQTPKHGSSAHAAGSLNLLSTRVFVVIGVLCSPSAVLAAPILGSDLASFTARSASTSTNVPASAVVGNVGVWSSGGAGAVTGFLSPPGAAVADPQVTNGLLHAGTAMGIPNALAVQAQLAIRKANLASLAKGKVLSLDDLLGLILPPGVSTAPAGTIDLPEALTLDEQGDDNAARVFQMPSTLISSTDSADVNTPFPGNNAGILAGSSGLNGGLDVSTSPTVLAEVSFLPFAAAIAGETLPEPGTLVLLGLGFASLGFSFRRRG